MGPQANDFHDFLVFQDLIHHAMLNIDSAGIGPFQIPHQLLKRRVGCEWVLFQNLQDSLCLGAQPRAG